MSDSTPKKQGKGKKEQIEPQESTDKEKGPEAFEKTPEQRRKDRVEGIIKTAVASILGIIAGVVAFLVLGTGTDTRWYAIIVIIAIVTYYVQRVIYPQINIDIKEFGIKDWFYVEFLVVDFALVTWVLMLN
ncbi:MAG: hypothetical protein ACLFMM_00475 [Methanohalobium sp.]|uniref:EMC6-like membrane protein n=1 Tax=Methanohalobium sp. TaxID=2837493 RepID=UPI00397E7D85